MEGPEKLEKNPLWIRPDLHKERGEIERAASEFLGLEPTDQNIEKILGILQTAPLVPLSEDEWEQLHNTDSFHNVRPGIIEDAEQITETYNQNLSPENKRDFRVLLDGFLNGKQMKAPVILKNMEGETHLVSGNTRLMIARALRMQPKVIMGEFR